MTEENAMNIAYQKISDYYPLYAYYQKIKEAVPYWLDADFALWKTSFIADADYDGDKMFRELVTYTAQCSGEIVGFIQFGIPCFLYDTKGKKSDTVRGGIIRNLYFDPEYDIGKELIDLAEAYFEENHVQRKFAFFHAFGMTCNAGHGKLFCGLTHVEKALAEFGYTKEHENVYYKRTLCEADRQADNSITVSYAPVNADGLREFSICTGGRRIGAGALVYLPQGDMCYLKWIYIEGSEQGKGYASAALYRIFADLTEKGIRRIDTDTADANHIAQHLYRKTGFQDMGRTRSYWVKV